MAANIVVLTGRLVADPDVKSTSGGKKVASFTLAVDKGGKDAGAHFFDVTTWEGLADIVGNHLGKGSQVLVNGSLNHQTWEQDGQKRSKVGVVARNIDFLSTPGGAKKESVASASNGSDPIDLSEIPF